MSNIKPTLVILAAGIGSRYGGLKQLDFFTKNKETILDFSLFDAINVGFSEVIFVIRKRYEKSFRQIFDYKLPKKIKVSYVYQEFDTIPSQFLHPDRIKPFGTGHALLTVKDFIKNNFAVINADDFYGRSSFLELQKFLVNTPTNSHHYCMIGYPLQNTISENGYVSRGECFLDKNNYLKRIVERTKIEENKGVLFYENDKKEMICIDKNTTVSMNMWGFTPQVFEYISSFFLEFLNTNKHNLQSEFYLPEIVNQLLLQNKATVKVLNTNANWFGVTYSKDKQKVATEINKLQDLNVYPKNLWS